MLALAEAVRDADGVAALSEQTLLRVRHGARGRGRFHLAYVDAEQGRVLAGCAFAEVSPGEPDSAEVAVAPQWRRHGLGRRLLDELWAHAERAACGCGRTAIWRRPGACRFRRPAADACAVEDAAAAARHGFGPVPTLPEPPCVPRSPRRWRSGRSGWGWTSRSGCAPTPALSLTIPNRAPHLGGPAAARTGAVVRPGGLLRRGGPRQRPDRGFPLDQSARRRGRADRRGTGGRGLRRGGRPRLAGQRTGPGADAGGLHHLRDRGLPWVLLYVDEENRPAVRLYRSLGFELWESDVMYGRVPEER